MTYNIGAIFPISSKQATSIFKQNKRIFVKYTNMKDFNKGAIIVFYLSKKKKLVGEAVAKKIERLSPEVAWSNYGSQIFISQDEFSEYTSWSSIERKKRANSLITAFVLDGVKEYKTPQPTEALAPSGHYLTKESYEKIKG